MPISMMSSNVARFTMFPDCMYVYSCYEIGTEGEYRIYLSRDESCDESVNNECVYL